MVEKNPNNQVEAILSLEKLEKRARLRARTLLADLPENLLPLYKRRANEEAQKGTI